MILSQPRCRDSVNAEQHTHALQPLHACIASLVSSIADTQRLSGKRFSVSGLVQCDAYTMAWRAHTQRSSVIGMP